MINNKTNKYMSIVCVISVLSQIPYIYNSAIFSKLSSIAWFLFAGLLLINNGYTICKSNIVLFPVLFDLYCLIMEMISGNNYIGADLFRPVNLCTFVFLVGILESRFFDFKSLIIFVKSYIGGTLITSIIIYFKYCFGRAITGNGYLYNGKNSLASIVLISIILTVVLREYLFISKLEKIGMKLLIVYNIYFLFILKSRTTLVCLAVLIVWFVVSRDTKWSVKVFVISVMGLITWVILSNQVLYDTVVNIIILNGKNSTNLNDITSNRMDHVAIFQTLFPGNEAFGIGGYYLESFPLTMLLSFGWVGSMGVFLFAISPILSGVKGLCQRNKDKVFTIILLAVSVSLLVNGIAEEQPPFGPGIKCFVMWFLYGIYCGQSNYVNLREKNNVKSFNSDILLHE